MIKSLPIILMSMSLTTAIAAESRQIETLIRERTDALMAKKLGVVGIVVGVQYGDETYTAAGGEIGLNYKTSPDRSTIFEIGSVSKVFTCLLLADAIARGEVTLDQPVEELLGHGISAPKFKGQPIRLVDLATHTSGLPRLPTNLAIKNIFNPYANYSVDDLHAFLAEYELGRAPGTKYEYSNVGMGLLGHALAKRAGKSYEELLVERICQPLGLSDTVVTLSDDQKSRFAKGIAGGVIPMPASPWDFPSLAGCGGIRSTLDDMLVFVRANLQPEKTELADAIRLSHQEHFTTHEPDEKSSVKTGVALGWHYTNGRIPYLWHNGMTGGYASFVAIVPEKKLGLVVLSNTASFEIDKFADGLLKELLLGEWD
jgi:CubicO group peptidase (beta-lactamase class C family)